MAFFKKMKTLNCVTYFKAFYLHSTFLKVPSKRKYYDASQKITSETKKQKENVHT